MSAAPKIKLAIIGVNGAIAPYLLPLLQAHANITTHLLLRPTSALPPTPFPHTRLDLTSLPALTTALHSFTHLLILSGGDGSTLDSQTHYIKAAIAAGVQHIIPSDFGCDLENPRIASLAILGDKLKLRRYLEENAEAGRIHWTAINTGPFLDWGLKTGFLGFDFKEKKALVVGSGGEENGVSMILLADVAKAIVGVLEAGEKVWDRAVFVRSAKVTARELVAIAEKVGGGKWEVVEKGEEEVREEGWKKGREGDKMGEFTGVIRSVLFGDGWGSGFEGSDNELLGVKELDGEGLEEMVKGLLEEVSEQE